MIFKNKNTLLSKRIDQQNDQICELVDQLSDREHEIESLKAQLEEKEMIISSMQSGHTMAAGVIDHYLNMVRYEMPQELIKMCQEAASEPNANENQFVELNDVISAIYAVSSKYLPKAQK